MRAARARQLDVAEPHPTIFGIYRSWVGFYFTFAVVAAFLVFAPTEWLIDLGINSWALTYRAYISFGLILFLTLFLVALLGPVVAWLADAAMHALHKLAVGRPLRFLSEPEQALLYWCLHHDMREFYVADDAETVQHLIEKHVLVPMGISHKAGKEGFVLMHVRKALWPKVCAQEDHLRKAMHMNHPAVADIVHALNKANH